MDAFASLIQQLPAGMVSTHPGELASHAHDAWAIDMLRDLRGDRVPPPGVVVFASSAEHVRTVLRWAKETRTAVVPRGGGSGVWGGAEAIQRCVLLDLSGMNQILGVDEVSQSVRAEAGVLGGALEAELNGHGLTIGHYPESLRVSTVGGWIAAAGAGYASAGYGNIEDILLGLTAVLPGGDRLDLPPTPRKVAGADLRPLFVGSDGVFGVITDATLAASRLPIAYAWDVFRPNSIQSGILLVREVIQGGFEPLIVRLLDPSEAILQFGGLGHQSGPILIVGYDAGAPAIEAKRVELMHLARQFGARPEAQELAEHWWEHRHDSVAQYGGIMGPDRSLGEGVVADSIEVAALWRSLPRLYDEVRGALLEHTQFVTCRLANPYRAGASLFFSFVLRGIDDHHVEKVYRQAWEDAAERCLKAHGTFVRIGGIGVVKGRFLEQELGPAAVASLRAIKAALDPDDIMNPGKAFPASEATPGP